MKSVTGEPPKKEKPAAQKVMENYPPCKEKCTLVAIASFADADGKNCYPSIAQVALRSGKSVRATQMHIRAMIDRNDIKVLYQKQRYHKAALNIFLFTHMKVKEALSGISRYQIKLPMGEQRGRTVPLSLETKKMIADLFKRDDEERTGLTSTGAIIPKIETVQRTTASMLQDIEMFESLGTDCTELRVKYGLPSRGSANSVSTGAASSAVNVETESALHATYTTGDAAD